MIQQKVKEVLHEPLTPTPGQAKFLLCFTDPTIEEIFYVGGVGAGKTQCLVQGVIDIAVQCPNSRIAVARKARVDVMNTTYEEFMLSLTSELLIKEDKEHSRLYLRTQNVYFPSVIEFRGLDDRSRWGSTQFSHIFIDEGSEISRLDFEFLKGRLRHPYNTQHADVLDWLRAAKCPYLYTYYDDTGVECTDVHRFIGVITNPVPDQHWIYDYCVIHKVPERALIQVSSRDNWKHLPVSYKKILENYPDNLKATKVEGEWGLEIAGPPCVPEFSKTKHVFDSPTPTEPVHIYRGWDFGYTYPAVSWWQLVDGKFYKWFEHLGKNEFLDQTCAIVQRISSQFHADTTFEDFVDHQAGSQHSDKGTKNSIELLRERGIYGKHKYSTPNDRIKLFNELFRDNKAFVHKRCASAITAYCGGYCRPEDGNIEGVDKDPKNPYHNVADSDGYVLFNLVGVRGRVKERTGVFSRVRNAFKPNYRAGYGY